MNASEQPPPPPFSPSSSSSSSPNGDGLPEDASTSVRVKHLESIIPIPPPPPFSPEEGEQEQPTTRISSEDVAKSTGSSSQEMNKPSSQSHHHALLLSASDSTSQATPVLDGSNTSPHKSPIPPPPPFSPSSSHDSSEEEAWKMGVSDENNFIARLVKEKEEEEQNAMSAAPSTNNGGSIQQQDRLPTPPPPPFEEANLSQQVPPVTMMSNHHATEPSVDYSKYYNYFGGFNPIGMEDPTAALQQPIRPQSQQPVIPKLDTKRFTEVNSEILPIQTEITNPQDGNKKVLSKTLGGCFACICLGPMLCCLCFFSLIELLCIILYEYFAARNYDPNPTPQDWTIIPMIFAAQIITFIVVVLCGVVSSLVATSSMCDTTLTKNETRSRFIISVIALIVSVFCILLLLVRGGLEGYTTQVLVDYKIIPAAQSQNFGQVVTTQYNVIPSIVIIAMFGLCVLLVALCGVCGLGCLCWFSWCSICLYKNRRKRETQQFGKSTTTYINNTYATRAVLP
ncbi:hypothetical protein C9374_003172 [Naegleria lovaniensis]|uniref:Transmembrane protein n=1 Tax=Naegleria lovaniensis TaxID=51637 RepID=A0AA88GU29_NAELO|nr:uncharacterized protein C9374_003172 [Naegleria lovaniensis]KAG2386023.1 hypothetical protein C9374_003172 [Naegleria lovaniensis]